MKLDLYLSGEPVGHLLDEPTIPGRYEYDPDHGAGHVKLTQALKQGKTVACSFTRSWKTVRLVITAEEFIESRGYLQVSEVWVRPRALLMVIAWLAIGIAILAWGAQ